MATNEGALSTTDHEVAPAEAWQPAAQGSGTPTDRRK